MPSVTIEQMSGETLTVDLFEGACFLNLATELAPRLNALRERLFFSQRGEGDNLTEYEAHDRVQAGETYQVFVGIAPEPFRYTLQDERQEDGTLCLTLRREEGMLHYRHEYVPKARDIYPHSDQHEWECRLPDLLEDEERIFQVRLSEEGWEMIRQAEERYATMEYQDEWDERPEIPEERRPLIRMYFQDFMNMEYDPFEVFLEGEEDTDYEDNTDDDTDNENENENDE